MIVWGRLTVEQPCRSYETCAGVAHYYVQVKADVRQPLAFAAVLAAFCSDTGGDGHRQTEIGIIPLASSRHLPFPFGMKPGRTLLDAGAEHCSDAELLAILLGSGGRGYSALDSANALLDKYGTLAGLMERPLDEIARVKGIKVVRAIRLAAAYEICQRLLKEVARDA